MNTEFDEWQQNQIRIRNEELNEISSRNVINPSSVNEIKVLFQNRINRAQQTIQRSSGVIVNEFSEGNSIPNESELTEVQPLIVNNDVSENINFLDQELGELIRSQRVSSLLNSADFRRTLEERLQSSLASVRPVLSNSNSRTQNTSSAPETSTTINIETLIDPNNDPEIQALVSYQIVSNMLQSAFRTHLENTLWSRHVRRERTSVPQPLNAHHELRTTSLSSNENNLLHTMRNELTEMKSMMRILLQSQIETHRSIRQEVTSVLRSNNGEYDSGQNNDLQSSCVICMNSTADTVVYRCGHLCLCYACSIQMRINIAAGIMTCPICRTPIEDMIRIFGSSHSLTN